MDQAEAAMVHVQIRDGAAPDSCSLTMTTNFGDEPFSNPWPFALSRLLTRNGLPCGGTVHVDLVMTALSKGGHLRVGMKDVLTLARGVPVETNAQLVERAVAMGELAQRRPMTPIEARELLGCR